VLLSDRFENFLIKTRNEDLLRNLQKKLVHLIVLCEAADHAHRTAVTTFLLWKN